MSNLPRQARAVVIGCGIVGNSDAYHPTAPGAGGGEVARTEERMQELARRIASAKSWGIEPVSLVTRAEVKELVPFIDETVILGGFYTPSVGVVDSLRAGTILRERGQASGRLSAFGSTQVLGIAVEGGCVRRVRTTGGDVDAEVVVIA